MWDDTSTAPAPVSSGSLGGFFDRVLGSAASRVEQEIQRDTARETTGAKTDPLYGVNEQGQVFFAGQATFADGRILGVPAPLVLVGVGILALAFILHSKG